ncbi:MAG: hypothetical protein DSZ23_01845 [Thermodesulfatator sp.]|nr:MAG: hypothetical protein DSZ23_01845 [Thermodesulfatator sp.]
MKLRQNARELVLIELSGSGLLLGEIRYNKQTETVLFTLEKSAFFDLYFPCTVSFDQNRGVTVHPHVVNAMTTSSIRVQRSRVSYFVLETDIVPALRSQYLGLINQIIGRAGGRTGGPSPGDDDTPPDDRPKGGSRLLDLKKLRNKKSGS